MNFAKIAPLTLLLLLMPAAVWGGAGASIEGTPANRVAAVLAGFLIASVAIEVFLHKLHHYFHHKHMVGMLDALEKIKDELMLVGTLSLILQLCQDDLAAICFRKSCSGIPNLSGYGSNHVLSDLLGRQTCAMFKYNSWTNPAPGPMSSPSAVPGPGPMTSPSTVPGPAPTIPAPGPSDGGRRRQRFLEAIGIDIISSRKLAGAGGPMCDSTKYCCNDIMGIEGHASQAICEDKSYESFVSVNAMHHIHTMIFFIAVVHILMSITVMTLASCKVARWKRWETAAGNMIEGNVPDDKLHKPPKFTHCYSRWLCGCLKQVWLNPDEFEYVALRQYFVSRENQAIDFDFHSFISHGLQDNFKDLVGMSWWMWGTLMAQICLKGFIIDIAFGVYFAFFTSLLVGAKLDTILVKLASDIFNAIDKDNSRTITMKEFKDIQNDNEIFNSIEPTFWCRSPKIMQFLTRLLVWQCATENAATVFYWYIFDDYHDSCYFHNRPWWLLTINSAMALVVMMHCANNIVPTYALVAHMGSHLKAHAIVRFTNVDAHMRRLTTFTGHIAEAGVHVAAKGAKGVVKSTTKVIPHSLSHLPGTGSFKDQGEARPSEAVHNGTDHGAVNVEKDEAKQGGGNASGEVKQGGEDTSGEAKQGGEEASGEAKQGGEEASGGTTAKSTSNEETVEIVTPFEESQDSKASSK